MRKTIHILGLFLALAPCVFAENFLQMGASALTGALGGGTPSSLLGASSGFDMSGFDPNAGNPSGMTAIDPASMGMGMSDDQAAAIRAMIGDATLVDPALAGQYPASTIPLTAVPVDPNAIGDASSFAGAVPGYPAQQTSGAPIASTSVAPAPSPQQPIVIYQQPPATAGVLTDTGAQSSSAQGSGLGTGDYTGIGLAGTGVLGVGGIAASKLMGSGTPTGPALTQDQAQALVQTGAYPPEVAKKDVAYGSIFIEKDKNGRATASIKKYIGFSRPLYWALSDEEKFAYDQRLAKSQALLEEFTNNKLGATPTMPSRSAYDYLPSYEALPVESEAEVGELYKTMDSGKLTAKIKKPSLVTQMTWNEDEKTAYEEKARQSDQLLKDIKARPQAALRQATPTSKRVAPLPHLPTQRPTPRFVSDAQPKTVPHVRAPQRVAPPRPAPKQRYVRVE